MKRKRLLTLIGAASVLAISAFTAVSSNGSQVYYTDSPVDTPGNCSGCHRSGTAAVGPTFTAVPSFGTGNTFIPGTTYTISVGETGYPDYGFDLEICSKNSTTCTDGGTFVAAKTACKFHAPSTPYPTNVTHTNTTAKATKASFTWKAPATGKAYMYMCMVGVNGDGSVNGDKAQDDSIILSPSPTGIQNLTENKTELNFFPNPASDILHLTYTLDKRSSVSIQLYNLEGRLVSTLLNQIQDAGDQNFTAVLPADLSKGIYMLHLLVDDQPTMKKLVVR